MIGAILRDSETPPIVILQGDHGAQGVGPKGQMKTLNAYYLAGLGPEAVYESISPVNTFRGVFNGYFGGRLPLLEDRSCFSTVPRALRPDLHALTRASPGLARATSGVQWMRSDQVSTRREGRLGQARA